MELFLHALVQWLSDNNVIFPEAVNNEENKSYLMNFPADVNVKNCALVSQYDISLNAQNVPGACVRFIQFIFRNTSHTMAMTQSEALYEFFKNQADPIIEYTYSYEDAAHQVQTKKFFFIINLRSGSLKLNEDAQGNYRYALSVPITTNA